MFSLLSAAVRGVDALLAPLYAIGARRLAAQYHRLDCEPYAEPDAVEVPVERFVVVVQRPSMHEVIQPAE